VVAELVLAGVAMALTIAVVVSSMFGRPDQPQPDPPATSTRPAATSPGGPAPITITSNWSVMVTAFSSCDCREAA
jgi:hypothetical protein